MNRMLPLLAVLILALASCSRGGAARPQLGLAMHSLDDSASAAIRKSLETQALDRADLAIVDGQNQQAAEDMQVDSLYRKGLGALAVDPVDGKSLATMIDKAKTERVPVVFFDRKPSDEAMRSWDKLFFVGSTEADAGTAEGEILASYLEGERGAGQEQGRVDPVPHSSVRPGRTLGQLLRGLHGPSRSPGPQVGAASAPSTDAGNRGMPPSSPSSATGSRPWSAQTPRPPSRRDRGSQGRGLLQNPGRPSPSSALGSGEPSPAIADAINSGSPPRRGLRGPRGSQGKAVFDLAYALARGRDPSRAGWRDCRRQVCLGAVQEVHEPQPLR